MNRRSFLRSVSIAAASGLILPEFAKELLAPKRTIFLPTWSPAQFNLALHQRAMLELLSKRPLMFDYVVDGRVVDSKVITFRRPRAYQRAIPFESVAKAIEHYGVVEDLA